MFFKGRFQRSIKWLMLNIFRYSFHHHEVHPIVFNLIYNKVYFDKFKYEKIDFAYVAFFFAPDCIYTFFNIFVNYPFFVKY